LEPIDLVAYAFLGTLSLCFFGAWAMFLRTSYRAAGWKRVWRDFVIGVVTILIFGISSRLRVLHIEQLGKIVTGLLKLSGF
jgi:hypothetical protein